MPSPSQLSDDERATITRELFEDLQRETTPDRQQQLREEIARLNLDMTRRLAIRYRRRGVPDDDLRQVASLGLMKAIQGFRPELGRDFANYAVPTMMGEIKRYFRDKCWTVRPPRRISEIQSGAVAAMEDLEQELGREPTIREVAAELDEAAKAVGEALTARSCYAPQSLDARLDSETQSSFLDVVGQEDPQFARTELHCVLMDAMARLSERDRAIIRMRFFDELTQRQIAERIGVTQMQVSRLLSRIMLRLREDLTAADGSDRQRDHSERHTPRRISIPRRQPTSRLRTAS